MILWRQYNSVRSPTMDFIEARQSRRKVLTILKQQQADDAAFVNQIKTIAIDGKRRLLKALAGWLSSIDLDTAIPGRTRDAFAKIADRSLLDDWAGLKRKQTVLNLGLQSATNESRRTEHAYDQVAPWGLLTEAFADDEKKKTIGSLKARRDHATVIRKAAEQDIAANQHALSQKYESFLRGAQMPAHLQAICKDEELEPVILPILRQTRQQAENLWQAHALKHTKSTVEMEGAIAGLRSLYSCSSGQSDAAGFHLEGGQ
jgi:hypothetical protein